MTVTNTNIYLQSTKQECQQYYYVLHICICIGCVSKHKRINNQLKLKFKLFHFYPLCCSIFFFSEVLIKKKPFFNTMPCQHASCYERLYLEDIYIVIHTHVSYKKKSCTMYISMMMHMLVSLYPFEQYLSCYLFT